MKEIRADFISITENEDISKRSEYLSKTRIKKMLREKGAEITDTKGIGHAAFWKTRGRDYCTDIIHFEWLKELSNDSSRYKNK